MSNLRILGVARTFTNALKTRTSASTAGLLTRLDSVATTDINKHSSLTTSSSTSGRYEPSYLDEITYEPRYEAVQLSLKGHDFAVLESYRKLALQFAPRWAALSAWLIVTSSPLVLEIIIELTAGISACQSRVCKTHAFSWFSKLNKLRKWLD